MKPFALLTYAIIAIVIAGLVITLMIQFFPSEDVFDKIRDGLEFSETNSNLGIAHYTGTLQVDKGLIITKTALNKNNISLAVECNDPKLCCSNGEVCSKPIEWTYEKIKFKRNENIQTYARCNTHFNELVCRIYFGKMPAQAKIEEIDYVDEGGTITSIVKVKNIGENELTLGQNSLRILKKVGEDWLDTENSYPVKEIDLLVSNQEHSFVWETELMSGGEYKLEFKFEGTNSGYDIGSFELVVGENKECKMDESKVELQDLNKTHIRVVHFCEGCKFGYECLAKWIEKNDGNNYETYQTNSVYYIREMFNDERCDRELEEEKGYYSVQGNCIPGYALLATEDLDAGVCCIETLEAVSNPCEVEPDSVECVIDWLPLNQEYVCPTDPNVSAYTGSCNVNEWFNVSGTIE